MANNLQLIRDKSNNNSNNNYNNSNNNSNTETVTIDHEVLNPKEILTIDKIRSMYSEGSVDRGSYNYAGFTYATGDHIELRSRDAICLIYRVPVDGSPTDYAYVIYYFDPNSPIVNEDVRATEIIYPDGTVLRNDGAITTINDTHNGSVSSSDIMKTAYYPDRKDDLAYYNLYQDYWINGVPHISDDSSTSDASIRSINSNSTDGNTNTNNSNNNSYASTSANSNNNSDRNNNTDLKYITPDVPKYEDVCSTTIDQLNEKMNYMISNSWNIFSVWHSSFDWGDQYIMSEGNYEIYLNVNNDGTRTLFYVNKSSNYIDMIWNFDKNGKITEYNSIKFDEDGYALNNGGYGEYITDSDHHILGIANTNTNDSFSFTVEGGITVTCRLSDVTEVRTYADGSSVTIVRRESGHYIVKDTKSGKVLEEGDSEESARLYREYREYAQMLSDVYDGQSSTSRFNTSTEDSAVRSDYSYSKSRYTYKTNNGYALDLGAIPGTLSNFEIAEKYEEIVQNGNYNFHNGNIEYDYNGMKLTKFSDGTMSLLINGDSYTITNYYTGVDMTTGNQRSTVDVSTVVIQGHTYSVDDYL